jgi:hypothetical protein
MKKFILEESERERILNMHKTAIQKEFISEQSTPATPATPGGTKNPAAFVKQVGSISIDGTNALVFKTSKFPDGVTFTTKVTKTPDGTDQSGKVIPGSGVYNINLVSEPLTINYTFTCSSGLSYAGVKVVDPAIFTTNPVDNNKEFRGQEIGRLLGAMDRTKLTQSNPFVQEFKQEFCS